MADPQERKRLPFKLGSLELDFKELTIDGIELVNLELRRMYLATAKVHIEVMADSEEEQQKLKKAMLQEALQVSMHSQQGQSILESIEGMLLLLWVSTCSHLMTFKQLQQRVLDFAPKGKDLEAYKKLLAVEVAEMYNTLNAPEKEEVNPLKTEGGTA